MRKVTAYLSNDGKIYATEKDALSADRRYARLEIRRALYKGDLLAQVKRSFEEVSEGGTT
jgi:hypothetical protein